jgi:glycosyltransferase involved in cell wall biosynthesis
LEEFAPANKDIEFISLKPVVDRQRLYPLNSTRFLSHRIPFVTPYIHLIQGVNALKRLDRIERQIAEEINAGKFDLVFAHDCSMKRNPGVLKYLAPPSIYSSIKNIYYAPAKLLFEKIIRSNEERSIQYANCNLTNSYFSRELMFEHYMISARVVYLGVRSSVFRNHLTRRKNYAICVGRLTYAKGQRFIVQAFGLIPTRLRPQLVFLADAIDRNEATVVRNLASKLGVSIRIETVRDDESLVQLYNQARLFVYAPYLEPFGLVVLESMACGTPVVAVKEGGIREIVHHGETGLLVDRDTREFSNAVMRLLDNDNLYKRLSSNSVANVKSDWTWQRNCDELERHFDLLLR